MAEKIKGDFRKFKKIIIKNCPVKQDSVGQNITAKIHRG
jgi:hypothetical protein